jgi:putative FmdB family regulatory protein
MTEVMQRMADPGPAKCPHCRSKRIERVMSQTSFQLKGDGWYVTDYSRKDKEKKGAKSKSDGDSGGESKAESKSDTKSDTKTDKADAKKSKASAKSD